MIKNEENQVRFLLDRCDENGSVLIKKEDMELILKHQRELGIEEGKKAMGEILQRLDANINMDFSKETFGFHFDTTSYKYGLIDAKNIIKEKYDSLA